MKRKITNTVRADAGESAEEKRAREVEQQLRTGDEQKAAGAAMDEKFDKLLTGIDGMMKGMESLAKRVAAIEAAAPKTTATTAPKRPPGEELSDDDRAFDLELMTPEERQAGEAMPVAADEMDRRRRDAALSAQARADAVAAQHGLNAPPPMMGERLRDYRRRLLKEFKPMSSVYKNVDLAAIKDPTLFAIAERQILADAASDAARLSAPDGTLREIRKQAGGHTIIEFYGSPAAWMNEIAGHVQLKAKGDWKTPQGSLARG